MNFIKHYLAAMEKIAGDDRLHATHVSLYISLFTLWNLNRFENPLSVSREQLMTISKIGSRHTYHKCLHALSEYGYIHYRPSYNPLQGSSILMINFAPEERDTPKQTAPETTPAKVSSIQKIASENNINAPPTPVSKVAQVLVRPCDKNGTGSGQLPLIAVSKVAQVLVRSSDKNGTGSELVLHPSINNINLVNYKTTKGASEQKKEDAAINQKNKKESTKKKNNTTTMKRPTQAEVIEFFNEKKYPKQEAEKFFNYFESVGWKVGKNKPMANWQAAARNWMLNTQKYAANASTKSNHLQAPTPKRYDQPL